MVWSSALPSCSDRSCPCSQHCYTLVAHIPPGPTQDMPSCHPARFWCSSWGNWPLRMGRGLLRPHFYFQPSAQDGKYLETQGCPAHCSRWVLLHTCLERARSKRLALLQSREGQDFAIYMCVETERCFTLMWWEHSLGLSHLPWSISSNKFALTSPARKKTWKRSSSCNICDSRFPWMLPSREGTEKTWSSPPWQLLNDTGKGSPAEWLCFEALPCGPGFGHLWGSSNSTIHPPPCWWWELSLPSCLKHDCPLLWELYLRLGHPLFHCTCRANRQWNESTRSP